MKSRARHAVDNLRDLLSGEHLVDEKMKLRAYAVQTGAAQETLESFIVETEGETVFVLI